MFSKLYANQLLWIDEERLMQKSEKIEYDNPLLSEIQAKVMQFSFAVWCGYYWVRLMSSDVSRGARDIWRREETRYAPIQQKISWDKKENRVLQFEWFKYFQKMRRV